jgi:hypothetical protein
MLLLVALLLALVPVGSDQAYEKKSGEDLNVPRNLVNC